MSENIGGQSRHVALYVSDAKADKHVIETNWPAQQGGKHTGLTIDQDQFEPLYKQFGRDLVAAFKGLGGGNTWIELEYDEKELPGQYFSADVGTKGFAQVTKVRVGGSVGFHPTAGYHVFINHGPY